MRPRLASSVHPRFAEEGRRRGVHRHAPRLQRLVRAGRVIPPLGMAPGENFAVVDQDPQHRADDAVPDIPVHDKHGPEIDRLDPPPTARRTESVRIGRRSGPRQRREGGRRQIDEAGMVGERRPERRRAHRSHGLEIEVRALAPDHRGNLRGADLEDVAAALAHDPAAGTHRREDLVGDDRHQAGKGLHDDPGGAAAGPKRPVERAVSGVASVVHAQHGRDPDRPQTGHHRPDVGVFLFPVGGFVPAIGPCRRGRVGKAEFGAPRVDDDGIPVAVAAGNRHGLSAGDGGFVPLRQRYGERVPRRPRPPGGDPDLRRGQGGGGQQGGGERGRAGNAGHGTNEHRPPFPAASR